MSKYKPGYLDDDVEILDGVIVPRGFNPETVDKGIVGDPVPEDKQSKEMEQFAEDNDGVWVYVAGQPVCMAREE